MGELVSVVISVFNDEKYIRQSIESLLNQTYSNLEIIIINDGSNKETSQILEEIKQVDSRVRLIHQENHGLAYSLNRGMNEANGKFIARMDSDDISKKDRIRKQIEFLLKNENVVAVGSHADVIDKNGNFVYENKQPVTWDQIKTKLPESPFIHPSVMFRKKEALDVGGYPNVPISQDLFFFNKLAKKGKLINLDDSLLEYRVHPNSLSRKSRKVKKNVYKLLKIYLETDELDKSIVNNITNNLSSSKQKKEYFYHIYLAKKYLWNSFKPKCSRRHLKKALIIRTHMLDIIIVLVIYLITYLDKKLIKVIYDLYKK